MDKKPPLLFMRDIPKGQLPDNLTVNTGEDLIEIIKLFVNKDRYDFVKRGGKPDDTTSWKEYPFGVPIKKSKTLRFYVTDKLKEKELQKLRRKDYLNKELIDIVCDAIGDLFFERDRMSSCGKETLDEIFKILSMREKDYEG